MSGIGPSKDSKPNWIDTLYKNNVIGNNIATLYLSWNETNDEPKLDIGIQNNNYIKGGWYKHNMTFIHYSDFNSSVPNFVLGNISYNGTNVLSKPAILVPMEQSPNTITFGADHKAEYNAFVTEFKK